MKKHKDPILSFLFIIVGITVYATLFPFRFSPVHSEFLEWYGAEDLANWLDVLLNLYFFMPLGILCGILFHSKSGFLLSFCGAISLSLGVELIQAYIPGRYSSLRDVFLNSLGAFLGMLLTQMPIFDRELQTKMLRRLISLRGTLLLISLWMTVHFFPFFPNVSSHKLRLLSISTLGWQSISAKNLEIAFLAIFVILIWKEHHSSRSTLWFGSFLFLISPGQVLLWGREPVPAEIFASMLGLAVGLVLVAKGIEVEARWLAAIAVLLLAWRELQPFHWESVQVQNFKWIPLVASFETSRGESIRILCLKCFLYWYTLRQIHRSTGVTILRGSLAMAGVFMIAEFAQCYQIGRSPETTDSLIWLLGATPFLSIDDGQDQGL